MVHCLCHDRMLIPSRPPPSNFGFIIHQPSDHLKSHNMRYKTHPEETTASHRGRMWTKFHFLDNLRYQVIKWRWVDQEMCKQAHIAASLCVPLMYEDIYKFISFSGRGWGTSKHNCPVSYLLWWRRHVSATVGHLQVTKMYIVEDHKQYDHSIGAYCELSKRSRCRLDYTHWAKSTSSK